MKFLRLLVAIWCFALPTGASGAPVATQNTCQNGCNYVRYLQIPEICFVNWTITEGGWLDGARHGTCVCYYASTPEEGFWACVYDDHCEAEYTATFEGGLQFLCDDQGYSWGHSEPVTLDVSHCGEEKSVSFKLCDNIDCTECHACVLKMIVKCNDCTNRTALCPP